MKWLEEAWKRLGEAEIRGARHNPEIVGWWKAIGLGGIKDDETANCGAFVGAMLVHGGLSLDQIPIAARGSARAYAKIGAPCELREGAVAVLSRDEAGPAAGHTGFLLSWTAETVTLLNANVGDKVCVSTFPRNRLLAVRWPDVSEVREATATPAPLPTDVDVDSDKAPSPIPRLNHPIWTLLGISRTIRGALWSFFGGLILFFQDVLAFALEAAAKVQEMAPIQSVLASVGANIPNIGFAFVVWGVVWVGIAKVTPKPRPEAVAPKVSS